MLKWALQRQCGSAYDAPRVFDTNDMPDDVKTITLACGAFGAWVRLPHNQSFAPILIAEFDNGYWKSRPFLDDLCRSRVKYVWIMVPLVTTSSVRVVSKSLTCKSDNSDCFRDTVLSPAPKVMPENKLRFVPCKYTTDTIPSFALVTSNNCTNVVSSRCAFVMHKQLHMVLAPLNTWNAQLKLWRVWYSALVMHGKFANTTDVFDFHDSCGVIAFVQQLTVNNGEYTIMERGTTWTQVNRVHSRRAINPSVMASQVVVSKENTYPTVSVCKSKFEMFEHGDVDPITYICCTGEDVFSTPPGYEDTTITDLTIKRLYNMALDPSDAHATAEDNIALLQTVMNNAESFLHMCARTKPSPQELLKDMGKCCSLRGTELLNIVSTLWWPRDHEFVLFSDDVTECECDSLNEAIGYNAFVYDAFVRKVCVTLDVTKPARIQLVPKEGGSDMCLWCVPTGKIYNMLAMRRDNYELMETKTEQMMRGRHANYLPGGTRCLTVMLKTISSAILPLTAAVTTRNSTYNTQPKTTWLYTKKADILKRCSVISTSMHSSTTFFNEHISNTLPTSEYAVPREKAVALLNNVVLSSALCMLSIADTFTLCGVLHENGTYFPRVRFPNTMTNQVSDETRYMVWSKSSVRSANKRFCVRCTNSMGLDTESDNLRTLVVNALLSNSKEFQYLGSTHTIVTRDGYVCVQSGRSEIWRDQISQHKCQLCVLKSTRHENMIVPQSFDYTSSQSSIAETLLTTVINHGVKLYDEEDVTRYKCVSSSIILQCLIDYMTQDCDDEVINKIYFLVRDVMFCPKFDPRNDILSKQRFDIGSCFHLKQSQARQMPMMLVLAQMCVASMLYMYNGDDAMRCIDSECRVSNNLARHTLTLAFRSVVVGNNAVFALIRVARFLVEYKRSHIPTHGLYAPMDDTLRTVAPKLRSNGYQGEACRQLLKAILEINIRMACVMHNALSPMVVATSDNRLHVRGDRYNRLLADIMQGVVDYHFNNNYGTATCQISKPEGTHQGLFPCKLLVCQNDKRVQLCYCSVDTESLYDAEWCGCDGDDLVDIHCGVCRQTSCTHHFAYPDSTTCVKCGRDVVQTGDVVYAINNVARMIEPIRCIQNCDVENSTRAVDIASRVLRKTQTPLRYSERQYVTLPPTLLTPVATNADALVHVAANAMYAVEQYRRQLSVFEFVHMQNTYYDTLSSVVVVGTMIFGTLTWYRWCAAFSSNSDMLYTVTKCALQQLYKEDDIRHRVLDIVRGCKRDGWIEAFCWAMHDVNKMRAATETMLTAQRCCVSNSQQCDNNLLYLNTIQVARWCEFAARAALFQAKRVMLPTPVHFKLTQEMTAFTHSTVYMRSIMELYLFASHVGVCGDIVYDTILIEFVRFVTWLLRDIIDERYTGTTMNDHMHHLQFQVSPCVVCGVGMVDLMSGKCNQCNCRGTRFAVPFGCPKSLVVWCARDRAHELETCEVLPTYVECMDHCEFVDVVLKTLFEKRWCRDKTASRVTFLADILKCGRGHWCEMHNIDISKCKTVQHASLRWVLKKHSDFAQCFQSNAACSIETLAANCVKTLLPCDNQCVYSMHNHNSRIHSSVFAAENIFPLCTLDLIANTLVFYKNTHVQLHVNKSSAACIARLRKNSVVFNDLCKINLKMCLDMHSEIWRRLHDDTKFDQSVLKMVQQCAHMCCDNENKLVYEAYATCFNEILQAYVNKSLPLCATQYAFLQMQDGVFKPIASSLYDYAHTCNRVAFSLVCEPRDQKQRILSIKKVQNICTNTLKGIPLECECEPEDQFFTNIARKNWHHRVFDPSVYNAMKKGLILFTGVSQWQMEKLITFLQSQVLYSKSKRQKVH